MREENRTNSGYEGVGRFYDLFADDSDIPFFLKYAKKQGSPILDIAAGTGRVSFVLAKEGYKVVALEQSQSMLEVARNRLESIEQKYANNVSIIEGNMINFTLDYKFSLIIIPNSFSHALTTESQLSTLLCIHDHLVDNGIFILDLYPGAIQHEQVGFREHPVSLPDGTTVEREGEIRSDMLRQIMDLKLRYVVRDSEQNVIEEVNVVSSAALLFNREVDLLVRLSGFEVEMELGGFDESAYTPESFRRILILKKSIEE